MVVGQRLQQRMFPLLRRPLSALRPSSRTPNASPPHLFLYSAPSFLSSPSFQIRPPETAALVTGSLFLLFLFSLFFMSFRVPATSLLTSPQTPLTPPAAQHFIFLRHLKKKKQTKNKQTKQKKKKRRAFIDGSTSTLPQTRSKL